VGMEQCRAGSLNSSKNRRFRFFKYSRMKRTTGSGYFKSFERMGVLHQRTGISLSGSLTFLKKNMEENGSYMSRTRFFEFSENQPVNGRVPKMISCGYLRSVDRGDACGRV
jgi:hypothetical protein